ncbi:MAG: acetylxylan esterase [Limisphaerales bacterium]
MQFSRFAVALGVVFVTFNACAQPKGFNYDEAKVPNYTLPDPLKFSDGTPVKTAKDWSGRRRAEILKLFQQEVYGAVPKRFGPLRYRVLSIDDNAFGGKATRKQIQIQLTEKRYGPLVDLLIYLPNGAKGPVPAFIGYNFDGNHAIQADPEIKLPDSWMRKTKSHRASDAGRGKKANRWDVNQILDRGYALATMYYGDVEPDHKNGWMSSLRAYHLPAGRTTPAPEQWGAIAAWSYGLSRAMDYFEKDGDINQKQVALMGHSRLGKTSLWGGASDERFAIVISNNSGCGGAALSRRHFGETVKRINTSFPHWFNENYNKYNDKEDTCPVDQHMLIALMAPRPVYVASAEKDQWADPNGEFTSAKLAEPVYALFGLKGLGVDKQPGLDQPVGDRIGYHYRTGKHDVLPYDWTQYLNFADRHFGRLAKK